MVGSHQVFRRALLRRLSVQVAVLVAATGVGAGCTGSVEPSRLNPTTLEAVTSTILTGTVGTEVTPAPTVRVKDENGNPMQGVAVQFQLTVGGGTLQSAAVQTDLDGVATAAWTLGPRAEVSGLTASSHGMKVEFTATAAAGPASYLSPVVSDIGQLGITGAPAGHPSVDVRDQFGNPVAGVTVIFTVTSGGGTIEGNHAIANPFGIATSGWWTLGTPGENTLSASLPGVQSVVFTVTALPVTGTYELESISLGDFPLFKMPSRIVLAEHGQFTTFVEGIVGHGVYEIANSAMLLKYSNGFLRELGDSLDYWPGGSGLGPGQERGMVSAGAILLYRCWGEDCYDSYWTYRRAVP